MRHPVDTVTCNGNTIVLLYNLANAKYIGYTPGRGNIVPRNVNNA